MQEVDIDILLGRINIVCAFIQFVAITYSMYQMYRAHVNWEKKINSWFNEDNSNGAQ